MYAYIYIYIYIYIYLTPPHVQNVTQTNFLTEFNRFEFIVFPSPRLVA